MRFRALIYLSSFALVVMSSLTLAQEDPCPEAFSALAKVTQGLAKRENVHQISIDDRLVDFENPRLRVLTMRDERGRTIGSLKYHYSPDGRTLHIEDSDTGVTFRRLGVNEALIERALREMPSIEQICAHRLVSLNESRIRDALREGLTMTEAIGKSPAYRANARLGFSEIVPESLDPANLSLCVRRPGR